MNLDTVSVIVPVYNGEATIIRACNSVLMQMGPRVELVVVDDGSTDKTPELLKSLAERDSRVVVYRQENSGVSKARNMGLDIVKGDYIMFLDADDELVLGSLQTMLGIMQLHQCDIVAGISERVRADGSSFLRNMSIDGEFEVWRGQEAFLRSLKDHPATYAVWGKLYRREVLETTRFVEGKKLHEDSFFLFELLRQNVTMVVTRTVVLRYYLTEGSVSRGMFSAKFLDMIYFAQRKYEIIERNYPELVPLGKNVLVKANMALLRNMWKPGAEAFRKEEQLCQKVVRENAQYFISTSRLDRIVFLVVRLHLFWAYKLLYRLLRK